MARGASGVRSASRKPKHGTTRKTTAKKPVAAAPHTFRIQALDPRAKCGPATSVQALYRLEERGDARPVFHLVFLDRHGWYCEHGPACPAVAQAKKFDRLEGSPRTRPQPAG